MVSFKNKMTTTDTNWIIHPLFVSQRGNKSAAITTIQPIRGPITCIVKDTQTPFNVSSWTPGDNRLTLDLAVNTEAREFAEQLDKFVLDTVSANPTAFFKKAHTYEEVKEMYKPTIHEHERCPPTIRTKMDQTTVRCWDKDNTPMEAPDDWRQANLTVQISVKGLWFMSNQFGVTLEVKDAQITPFNPTGSPFTVPGGESLLNTNVNNR